MKNLSLFTLSLMLLQTLHTVFFFFFIEHKIRVFGVSFKKHFSIQQKFLELQFSEAIWKLFLSRSKFGSEN